MATRDDVTRALRESLDNHGQIQPIFGMDDVDDLNADLHRFLRQAGALATLRVPWPCVIVQPVNDELEPAGEQRAVPIDLQSHLQDDPLKPLPPPVIAEAAEFETEEARKQGLIIWNAPLQQAQQTFFEGLTDQLFSRIGWRARQPAASSTQMPKVTVTSFPAAQQAKWSVGHYFSTGKTFGHTNYSQQVTPGHYSFWLATIQPTLTTPAVQSYHITQDRTVPL